MENVKVVIDNKTGKEIKVTKVSDSEFTIEREDEALIQVKIPAFLLPKKPVVE